MNTDTFLNNIKTITESFIKSNYTDELQFFDSFWQVFSAKIEEVAKSNFTKSVGLKPANLIISEISLVRENSLDLMTPVVMGVMAEIMFESRSAILSADKLEKTIASSAARQGAKPSLTACLIRYIPELYNGLLQTNDAAQAAVSEVITQYRIWTAGRTDIVQSIEQFEKDKTKYLFWLDLDEKQHISVVDSKLKLPIQSAKMLHCMIKHIGSPTPKEALFKEVFLHERQMKDTDIDNIEQNLTKLHKFCGNNFRQHLFTNHKQGFGLKDSFRDKYFLFERLHK